MIFLVLLVFCFSVKANNVFENSNSCGFEIKSKSFDNGFRENEDEVTNDDYIIEPCDYDDYDCMRDFMAVNSNCKPAYGPIPDPVYLHQTTLYLVKNNLTLSYFKPSVTGLSDASVMSYYYNKKTKVLLLALEITILSLEIPKLYITYRRPGLESICKFDYGNVTFESLIFTLPIPKIGGKFRLDLVNAQRIYYVGEAVPDYYIGPRAYVSTDPTVIAEFESFKKSQPLSVRTGLLNIAELLTALYIQTFLCDFGVKLYTS